MDEQSWTVAARVDVLSASDPRLLIHVAFGAPPHEASATSIGPVPFQRNDILFVSMDFKPDAALAQEGRLVTFGGIPSQIVVNDQLEVLADSMTGMHHLTTRPQGAVELDSDGLWMTWPGWHVQTLDLAAGVVWLLASVEWCTDSDRIMRTTHFRVQLSFDPLTGQDAC